MEIIFVSWVASCAVVLFTKNSTLFFLMHLLHVLEYAGHRSYNFLHLLNLFLDKFIHAIKFVWPFLNFIDLLKSDYNSLGVALLY